MNNSADNLIETNALIEQHLHGGFGIDFSNCTAADFIEFSKKILKYGVCGFYPTLVTDTIEHIRTQIYEIKKAIEFQESEKLQCAKILGIHLEAIFLNPQKKGIHDESLFLKPTVDNFQKIEDKTIKIVTLAPELDENFELCKYLKSKGIRVSAGHCKGADLCEVQQVTHLYNAMGEFSHREPSTVVSALTNDNIYTEIIADGKHVQDNVLKITFRTKPLNKIILISDALPITHSNLESIEFCGETVFLKNGKAVDANGTMAGSTTFVSDIIKRIVKLDMIDLRTAVTMASTNINNAAINDIEILNNTKIYWTHDLDICAMNINSDIITF